MQPSVKWYEKNWFLVLCFVSIIFIPLGIFLIWKKNKLNKTLKMSLSLVSGAIFLSVPFYLVHNSLNAETDQIVYEESMQTFKSLNEENKAEIYKPPTNVQIERNQSEEPTLNNKSSEKENSLNVLQSTKANTQTKNHSVENQKEVDPQPIRSDEPKLEEDPENPEDPESRIVYVTQRGKKYHYKNKCGRGRYRPITLKEAKKNYAPCKKCVK